METQTTPNTTGITADDTNPTVKQIHLIGQLQDELEVKINDVTTHGTKKTCSHLIDQLLAILKNDPTTHQEAPGKDKTDAAPAAHPAQ